MRIGDFYGKIEFLDVLQPVQIRHDAKWVVRRAFNIANVGVSPGDAVLPDAVEYDFQPGKEVWITNNGDPASPPGGGYWRAFDVVDPNQPSAFGVIDTLAYPETGVYMLASDGRWRLARRFGSVEFTALSEGWENVYTIDIKSNRQNLDVDREIRLMGWDGESDVFVELIVRSGAVIGSASTSLPSVKATLTGQDSQLFVLVESGAAITAAGGRGGNGGLGGATPTSGTNGEDGGPAIRAETLITISNSGTISGGGGGGAGANGNALGPGPGGGGGAGWLSGLGGSGAGNPPAQSGTGLIGGAGGFNQYAGVIRQGGTGGDRGLSGTSSTLGSATGGAGGAWIQYSSFGLTFGTQQPFIYASTGQQLGGTEVLP